MDNRFKESPISDTEHQVIAEILDEFEIRHYYINADGTVDTEDDVDFKNLNLSKLPVQFGSVGGRFDCSGNKLKSLKGCPTYVGKGFYCDNNNLIDLAYAPETVMGEFDCSGNKIVSLKGVQSLIKSHFTCSFNRLETLVGGPEYVEGNYDCNTNKLQSLKGCAKEVGGDFDCGLNYLDSIEYAPKKIGGDFDATQNLIELEGRMMLEIDEYRIRVGGEAIAVY
jgi:thiamine pyrophosphokinase